MILKINSSGENVKILQRFLQITDDGIFGKITEQKVKDWQGKNGLVADGIVGPVTWKSMGLDTMATTDIQERPNFVIKPQLTYVQHFMPPTEYYPGKTKKEWLFLHHTAGGHNPYFVADMWAKDDRGKVGTEFILGGRECLGRDDRFDGLLVQCFPAGGYGWHLGTGNNPMHTNSVGIEVCNYGYVTKGGYTWNGKWVAKNPDNFYNYVGGVVNHITELAQPFRGFKFWHRYSDKQISALKDFILFIANRDGIDVRKGLIELIKKEGEFKAFDKMDVAMCTNTKGMWSHTNVLRGKVDMFPQAELVQMLLSI